MGRTSKVLISLFLIVHLGAYTIRITPFAAPAARVQIAIGGAQTSLFELVRWYQRYTVTAVSGQLFAPLPSRSNTFLGAMVELADGSIQEHRFPSPRDFAGWQSKGLEPFHKFGVALQDKSNEPYYGDVCRFVTRQHAKGPSLPVRVRLITYFMPIPRHNRPEIRRAVQVPWFDYSRLLRDEASYGEQLLLEYTVQPEDIA